MSNLPPGRGRVGEQPLRSSHTGRKRAAGNLGRAQNGRASIEIHAAGICPRRYYYDERVKPQ